MTQGDGPVALVSAGSRGIGAAIVGRLAARGWDVSFGYDRDEHSAREVERAARELGARVTAVRVRDEVAPLIYRDGGYAAAAALPTKR